MSEAGHPENEVLADLERHCKHFAELIRLICESTPSSDRGLRDMMVMSYQRAKEKHAGSSLAVYNIVDEVPGFASDLAKMRLSSPNTDVTPVATNLEVLLMPCHKGIWNCPSPECQLERAKNLLCWYCGAVGEMGREASPDLQPA
jgi:hypothetical protein